MQHEVLTQRAAKPCQQVMMVGEAVIASSDITSDREIMPYICVP